MERMEEEEAEESVDIFVKGLKVKLRFLGFYFRATGRQRRLERRACGCMHQHVRTVAQCRDGWQRRLEATQGLSLCSHSKCQGRVGMEEELAQNETRQCLQASLFSILMSPATCSASADLGSTGTARQPHSHPLRARCSKETQKATYGWRGQHRLSV